jgi:hypothetical protein
MKLVIRSLNEAGIAQFRSWLEAGARGDAPVGLLSDPKSSEPVPGAAEVEYLPFGSRYDLATHVLASLSGSDLTRISFDRGLWAWLSLFYIDLLCPFQNGTRKLKSFYRYILTSEFRTYYRHLVREAVVLVRDHGERARLFLTSQGSGITGGEFAEAIASRPDLVSNKALVEVAWKLYFDSSKNSPKRGATTPRKPGTLRRYVAIVQQLDLNYDLQAMTAQQILALLPQEFDKWHQPQATERT